MLNLSEVKLTRDMKTTTFAVKTEAMSSYEIQADAVDSSSVFDRKLN